jgi:hypothetical protein
LSSSFKRDNVGRTISADFSRFRGRFQSEGVSSLPRGSRCKGGLDVAGGFRLCRTSNFISQTETHHPVRIPGPPNVYCMCPVDSILL